MSFPPRSSTGSASSSATSRRATRPAPATPPSPRASAPPPKRSRRRRRRRRSRRPTRTTPRTSRTNSRPSSSSSRSGASSASRAPRRRRRQSTPTDAASVRRRRRRRRRRPPATPPKRVSFLFLFPSSSFVWFLVFLIAVSAKINELTPMTSSTTAISNLVRPPTITAPPILRSRFIESKERRRRNQNERSPGSLLAVDPRRALRYRVSFFLVVIRATSSMSSALGAKEETKETTKQNRLPSFPVA